MEAAKLVAKSVEGVVQSSKMATEDENLLRGVGEAATAVTKALNDLLQHVKAGTGGKPGSQYDDACDRIMTATDKLFSSVGNAGEMVRQAKMLAQVRCCGLHSQGGIVHYNYDRILVTTDTLFSSVGNAGEIVRQAKMLAQVRHCVDYIVRVV